MAEFLQPPPDAKSQLTLEGEEFPAISDARSCRATVKAATSKKEDNAYLVARVWRLVSCMPFP